MKNLEQIRAAAALAFWQGGNARGVAGGNVVSKLGSLIIRDGLLSTLAFCVAKGAGHESLGTEICRYAFERINLMPAHAQRPTSNQLQQRRDNQDRPRQQTLLERYIDTLAGEDSAKLRLATQEALRYLDYLKRFEPESNNNEDGGRS